jgi:hypothetical protein
MGLERGIFDGPALLARTTFEFLLPTLIGNIPVADMMRVSKTGYSNHDVFQ